MRKKSMNSTYVGADFSAVVSSVIVDKLDPVSQCTRNDGAVKCNGDVHWVTQSSHPTMDAEEEAAFMRSLGWEPNAGDDKGLSEEEINAFFQEYIKLRPTSKLSQSLWSNIVTKSDPQSTWRSFLRIEPS
ncbi:hypothetical protein Nepgr_002130 [Nepenthes gracilis]|uniref:Uncharacterized protein n=1 Tax=Nepenthes gracilis TaxID=150966 RepID=A0AAD3RY10_NEPGR|nr:hypothetical protein Nepgr_002130 [Nepenthes gracilis]